jgi:hypothetical protein
LYSSLTNSSQIRREAFNGPNSFSKVFNSSKTLGKNVSFSFLETVESAAGYPNIRHYLKIKIKSSK